nr:dexh-box atp-dependent rna helicase dexh18, mitochondrial [Quercus suber]
MYHKVYETRSYNAKDKVKYMAWTSEMDRCLTEILVEEVKKGNKIDSSHSTLKPAAYRAALTALNENFVLDLTKEHIRNRLKTWRKQFGILRELLAHKGFKWDETRKMVIADNSVVWQPYIEDTIAKLAQYYLIMGCEIWRPVIPVICFHIRGWHHFDSCDLAINSTGISASLGTLLDTVAILLRGEKRTGDPHSETELHFNSFLPILPSRCPKPSIFHFSFHFVHLLAPCKFPSQPLKFKASATLYAKPFSSSSAPNGDDDHGVSSLTMVESESECDFDADVGKTTIGLLHSLDDEGCSIVGDSTMVELGNGVNEEGIIVDSMVASDNNDDVGLERCEGHLNVASLDPVEVYRDLRNAEKGAKQTRCDWEIMQEVFSYFGKSSWVSNQALAI